MLRTQDEIELLAKAQEPGIRDPLRAEYGIDNILNDFFRGVSFRGKRVIELGPGHYEFCEAARRRGARAEAVELDPVVVELGRRRGFSVIQGDLVQLPEIPLEGVYDGIFSKGSTNPFWFHGNEAALRVYIHHLRKVLARDGWAWIVACPWTSKDLTPAQKLEWLRLERQVYVENGFTHWSVPNRFFAGFYGVNYVRPQLDVFTLNLAPHRWRPSVAGRMAGYVSEVFSRKLRRQFAHRSPGEPT